MNIIDLFPGILRNHIEIDRNDIRMLPLRTTKPKKQRKRSNIKGGYINIKYCNTLDEGCPPNSPS
jgi:hypothetical protein